MERTFEYIFGRRLMWKIGRRLYYAARREGSLDFARNGEALLQRCFAQRSRDLGRPLTIVDVGGNLGQWSSLMLSALDRAGAPPCTLTVFEPIPAIFAQLENNLAGFKRHAIRLVPKAAAESERHDRAIAGGDQAGNHHIISDDLPIAGDLLEIEVTTLDNVFSAPEVAIDFLKIDAEGFDPMVIEGAKGLLSGGRIGLIQFEYSVLFMRTRSYLYDVFALATANGYQAGLLTGAGIEVFDRWHPDLEQFIASNMILCRPDLLDWLPARAAYYRPDNTRQLRSLPPRPPLTTLEPAAPRLGTDA